MSSQKHEFLLEGLDCANCAAKIESEIQQIQGVSSCSVNLMTKTLTLETTEGYNEVVRETRQLVKKIEPDVQVKEKYEDIHLVLQGLNCANCASKIEEKIACLNHVKTTEMNFIQKKLLLRINSDDKNATLDKIKEIITNIEPSVTIEQDYEIKDTNKQAIPYRLLIGSVISGCALLLSMPEVFKFILFMLAYILVGGDVVRKAVKHAIHGKWLDENFLMTLATIGAFAIGQYPEGVAVMLFYEIGEYFQSLAVHRSRKSIAALLDIRPDFANIVKAGNVKRVSPTKVQIGDSIIVKPGEKVPLDGIVIRGTSFVDTSAITGEPIPREAVEGSTVLSGFVNQNGVITVKVTKEYNNSTVSKILELVQNASSKKAQAETFITKFARIYTPFVVVTAAALACIPPLVLQDASFKDWLYRSLVFLVISCPCALVVSIPLSFFGGIGAASKRGILIKGSNYLEALTHAQYVVFDKTGTLTKGKFTVTSLHPQGRITKEELIEAAAFAEIHSNHPIGVSIRNYYGKTLNEDQIDYYEEKPGLGTHVTVHGKDILVGNARFMEISQIPFRLSTEIGTIVYIGIDGIYAGYIVISDECKEDSEKAVQTLKRLGIKQTVMLTGDSREAAYNIGRKLGIDEVYAELLPHQKVEKVEMIETSKLPNETLIFVGDGMNDTPVLARADIGVAMGGIGSDAAIEAADIVIMTDEPSKLPEAIRISKRTRTIVYQNIIFALGVKGLFLVLGALGYATMWEAVFSDVGVTLLAVFNALRTLRV